jgi:tetratricopeptide (TPR) repeat protein
LIELNEGNYAAAREKFSKALAMRQAIGDRTGEAATWHNLATIELREVNYAAAREKFGKSLAIEQAIGNRAGEAATWHQLGFITWKTEKKESAVKLVAIATLLTSEVGAAEKQIAWKNLIQMAAKLGSNGSECHLARSS